MRLWQQIRLLMSDDSDLEDLEECFYQESGLDISIQSVSEAEDHEEESSFRDPNEDQFDSSDAEFQSGANVLKSNVKIPVSEDHMRRQPSKGTAQVESQKSTRMMFKLCLKMLRIRIVLWPISITPSPDFAILMQICVG